MTERQMLTPMEEDFPAICEWVRHGCVRLDNLRAELEKALEWVGPAETAAE